MCLCLRTINREPQRSLVIIGVAVPSERKDPICRLRIGDMANRHSVKHPPLTAGRAAIPMAHHAPHLDHAAGLSGLASATLHLLHYVSPTASPALIIASSCFLGAEITVRHMAPTQVKKLMFASLARSHDHDRMFRSRSRSQRKIAFIKAQMRRGPDWQEVTIGNASETGLMVKCAEPPAAGAEVEIRRRGVCIIGKVVWATRTRFGMQATEPIDLEGLAADSDLQARSAGPRTPQPGTSLWHWRRSRRP